MGYEYSCSLEISFSYTADTFPGNAIERATVRSSFHTALRRANTVLTPQERPSKRLAIYWIYLFWIGMNQSPPKRPNLVKYPILCWFCQQNRDLIWTTFQLRFWALLGFGNSTTRIQPLCLILNVYFCVYLYWNLSFKLYVWRFHHVVSCLC